MGLRSEQRGQYYPVVVFDLDGTLMRATSVSAFLAQEAGKSREIEDLERQFAAGAISNRAIADASAEWFRGLRVADVWRALERAPWIDGLNETVEALRDDGCRLLLATVTWRFASELLLTRGFEATCGTRMDVEHGILSGVVARHFDEWDKAAFIETWCAARAISLSDVAAVGDSRSDLPLFQRVGRTVALNATPDAREAAGLAIDTEDLREVLPLLRRRQAT